MNYQEIIRALREREARRRASTRRYPESRESVRTQVEIFREIGNILLHKQGRSFVIDEDNLNVIIYLISYVNSWEDSFRQTALTLTGEEQSLDLPILLCGDMGVGKTLLMQILSEFSKALGLMSRHFVNVSLTELQNYFATFSNIDYYTYNADRKLLDPTNPYSGKPFSVCLHDIGLEQDQRLKSYGTDLGAIVSSFLMARYDLFQSEGLRCHMTTNQTAEWIFDHYPPRLVDRFKEYNFITLSGKGRR